MKITGVLHFNVNCSDFERSRAFYEALGFRVVWEIPEHGPPEIARAVGMPSYTLRGALMALEGESTMIDLIEWKHPRDDTPPYPHLYHLGVARIALRTTDLASDVAALRSIGAELIAEPATVAGLGSAGTRFVCFKDPDGTTLELVEVLEA